MEKVPPQGRRETNFIHHDSEVSSSNRGGFGAFFGTLLRVRVRARKRFCSQTNDYVVLILLFVTIQRRKEKRQMEDRCRNSGWTLADSERESGWNVTQAELCVVCASWVSTHFKQSFISCQRRTCFLSPCLSITRCISASISHFLFLASSPSQSLCSPKWWVFRVFGPFIPPRRESVSKSGYTMDTRSVGFDCLERLIRLMKADICLHI